MTSVNADAFRQAMCGLPSGVSIVTTVHEGVRIGMTVSAVCSLSVEPPLLLACIARRAIAHDAIAAAGRFAVSVLAEGAERTALQFARPADDKFRGIAIDEIEGLPLVRAATAQFVCRLAERLPGGDHSIFVGEVIVCRRPTGSERPQLYFDRRFRRLHDPESALVHDLAALGM